MEKRNDMTAHKSWNTADVAAVCKALGDTNRLKIIRMLSGCEKCACVILEEFDITQPTLSHHMKILSNCGLVNVRKEGKWNYYSLNGETLAAFRGFIDSLECEVHETDCGKECCCR